jgi:hypothetical protein
MNIITWRWTKDGDAPRGWEQLEDTVLHIPRLPATEADGALATMAKRAYLRAADQGAVVVVEHSLESLMRVGDRIARVFPALRIEKQADLSDGCVDALTALKLSALVVAPLEPLTWPLGLAVDLVLMPDVLHYPPSVRAARDHAAESGAAFLFAGWGDDLPPKQTPGCLDGKAYLTVPAGFGAQVPVA